MISAVQEYKARKGDGKHHDLLMTVQQRRWGIIFDRMVRKGLIKATFGQSPEEGKEGETTNVNVLRQQKY